MAAPVPVRVRPARHTDAGELFTLQRAAYVGEAQRRRDPFLGPLTDEVDDLAQVVDDPATTWLVATTDRDGEHGRRGRLVGSIRLTVRADGTGCVGRVVVAPDLRGRGLGTALLEALHAEVDHRADVRVLELSTGTAATADLALYRRFGYAEAGTVVDAEGRDVPVMRRTVD
jgi:GNAT superfamily N-acetyltransferase